MRTQALSLFVYFVVLVTPVSAQDAVRAMDPAAAEAFEHGRATSPSFRELLTGFDPTKIVVHVVSGQVTVFGTSGSTRLAGRAGAWRYLRITLDPGLALDERTAVLAHELQHVREIVTGAAATQREVELLYERIGRKVVSTHNAFETPEAVAAGSRVWRELRTAARRAASARVAVED